MQLKHCQHSRPAEVNKQRVLLSPALQSLAAKHYAEHEGKPFFEKVCTRLKNWCSSWSFLHLGASSFHAHSYAFNCPAVVLLLCCSAETQQSMLYALFACAPDPLLSCSVLAWHTCATWGLLPSVTLSKLALFQ